MTGLVCCCDPMFFLSICWFWPNFNVFQLQSLQPSNLQVNINIQRCYTCQHHSNFKAQLYSWFQVYVFALCRDSTIVSIADTGTSILAGVTIFSILGNLAHESGKPIEAVVKGGTGSAIINLIPSLWAKKWMCTFFFFFWRIRLAFVSYPEAISKFDAVI